MRRPRVLLAEDHPAVAERLRAVLEQDCEVVGVVNNGQALLDAVKTLRPDVVVTDITMPEVDGITATERITQSMPEVRIVMVTVHNDPVLVQQAFKAGAKGYVLKITAGEDLPAAVKAVVAGELFVSPQARNGYMRAG